MFAAVLPQVDPLRPDRGAGHRRIDRERGLGDEGDHHPVVGGVGLDVDHTGARVSDRIRNRGDDIKATAFREIRDALYKGCQTTPPTTIVITRFTPT
jgi:hypothetical protein